MGGTPPSSNIVSKFANARLFAYPHFPTYVYIIVIYGALFSFIRTSLAKLGDTCDYLDGYVQFSKILATYENTRWALQELACREPHENILQRGYGCDGLDNTCDEDKQIDECAEDVFPPEISIAAHPSGYFRSEAAALDYLKQSVTAVDDCKPVTTSFEVSSGSGSCNPKLTVRAAAQGCNERPDYDVASMEFDNVLVDGTNPEVECTIGEQNLRGNGAGVFEDALFSYSASDDCSPNLHVEIEIQSDELETTRSDMVTLSVGTTPHLYVRDKFCTTGSSGACKISNKKGRSREYKAIVKVTDDAGNTGVATCSTVVGGTEASGEPLFTIASSVFQSPACTTCPTPARLAPAVKT